MRNIGLILAAVLLTAGCGYPGDPVIDGIRVGPVVECAGCDQPNPDVSCRSCDSVTDLARQDLRESWPEESTPTSLSFHEEGCPPSWVERCSRKRSGILWIVLAEFANGTQHALAVYCGVGGCDYRPGYQSRF